MIASVLTFLTKLGIGSIVGQLATAYKAREEAKTDRERMYWDHKIKVLETRRDVQVAEAGHKWSALVNSGIRASLALAVTILIWKVLVWDKALGQWTGGTTDKLSVELWGVVGAVIGFYFLHSTFGGKGK